MTLIPSVGDDITRSEDRAERLMRKDLLGEIKSHEYMDWPVDMTRAHALRTLQRIEHALREMKDHLQIEVVFHGLYRVKDVWDGTETGLYHRASDALLEWADAHEPDLKS